MKKFLVILTISLFLFACADSKDLKINGELTKVDPYGWFDQDEKVECVNYRICVVNIVLSIIFSETLIVPILVTGTQLWEPSSVRKECK